MIRKGFHYMLAMLVANMCFLRCKSVQTVTEIPADIYNVSSKDYTILDSGAKQLLSQKRIKIEVEELDGILSLKPVSEKFRPLEIKMSSIQNLKIYRYTFDVDILTIQFKIRS